MKNKQSMAYWFGYCQGLAGGYEENGEKIVLVLDKIFKSLDNKTLMKIVEVEI